MTFVRLGEFRSQPVHISAAMMALDLHIMHRKFESVKSRNFDLTDVVENVRVQAYLSFGYATTVVVVSVAAMVVIEKQSRVTIGEYWRQVAATGWRVAAASLDQEHFAPKLHSLRILWLFAVIAIFVVVSGYFCNLMSTDRVVTMERRHVENINDLFTPEFEHLRLVMLTQLYYFDFIKSAPNGSVTHRMYKRMLDQNCSNSIDTCSLMDFSMDNREDGVQFRSFFLRQMNKSEATHAMLWPKQLYSAAMTPVFCMAYPYLIPTMHMSRDPIATGMAVMVTNRELRQAARKYVDFRFAAWIEFGIAEKLISSVTYKLINVIYPLSDSEVPKITLCLAGVSLKNDQNPFTTIRLLHLRRTLVLCSLCVALSVIVLVVELTFVWCSSTRKTRRVWAKRTLLRYRT